MSLRWLFLGGLLSSRARLRFANDTIIGRAEEEEKPPSRGNNLCDESSNQFRPVLADRGLCEGGNSRCFLNSVPRPAGCPNLIFRRSFGPMRANECLVPVDPGGLLRKIKNW